MRGWVGVSQPTGDLIRDCDVLTVRRIKTEMMRFFVTWLLLGNRIVDRIAVDAWWRSGLKPLQVKAALPDSQTT